MSKKQDQKEIASKQNHEIQYITSTWFLDGKRLTASVLKDVIKRTGKSRRSVYVVLRYLGYAFKAKKK